MNLRFAVSISLCAWMATAASLVAQNSSSTAPARPSTIRAEDATDEQLAHFVGLEGQHAKVSKESSRIALQELVKRANTKQDGAAAYLVGCEYEAPTVSTANSNLAFRWFQYGANLNNIGSLFKYGLYLKYGMGGAQANVQYGQQLIDRTAADSYSPSNDPENEAYYKERMQTQRASSSTDKSNWVAGAVILVGLAALLSSTSDSNSKTDTGAQDNTALPSPAYPLNKSCTVPEMKWIPTAPGDGFGGHYETTYKTLYGYNCP